MEPKSMTAFISAFARAYHSENNAVKIFDDRIARRLFTDEEYGRISQNMMDGIGFFNPSFSGAKDDALRWIVDNQLSPAPLGRAAFAEKSLETAVSIGAKQYLILGAGYDTFAYRQPTWAKQIRIFEVDHPAVAKDKKMRLKASGIEIPDNVHYVAADFTKREWQSELLQCAVFRRDSVSFCSALGLAYYLEKEVFGRLCAILSSLLPEGSAVVFDYPDENGFTEKAGKQIRKQALLASAANEKMFAGYSYEELEKMLSAYGFLIYELLTPPQMTQSYFDAYNIANPLHRMTALDHVNYCLSVKKL